MREHSLIDKERAGPTKICPEPPKAQSSLHQCKRCEKHADKREKLERLRAYPNRSCDYSLRYSRSLCLNFRPTERLPIHKLSRSTYVDAGPFAQVSDSLTLHM